MKASNTIGGDTTAIYLSGPDAPRRPNAAAILYHRGNRTHPSHHLLSMGHQFLPSLSHQTIVQRDYHTAKTNNYSETSKKTKRTAKSGHLMKQKSYLQRRGAESGFQERKKPLATQRIFSKKLPVVIHELYPKNTCSFMSVLAASDRRDHSESDQGVRG